MRDTTGHSGRLSRKLKVAAAALLAMLTIGAIGATSASAAQTLDLSFTDGWIRVPAIDAIAGTGGGTFHALDPAAENAPTIGLSGGLDKDGNFSSKASDFSFPTQVIDAGTIGDINLEITAADDITGTYDRDTGAFSAQLPLTLKVLAPGFNMSCQVTPLNIPLSTSGSTDFLSDNGGPGVLNGTPFASGGDVLGSWTGVTVADVTGFNGSSDQNCQDVIQGLIGEADSFDGSLWMSGTSAVTGTLDPENCPAGQIGTPPACTPAPTLFKVSKVAIRPKKGTVKAGKKIKLKVKVTNSGGTKGTAKVTLKSTNRKVTLPKSVKIKVAAGKSATKRITVKVSKKAKGKATITARSGSKSGKSKLTVKAAKKKHKKKRK